MKQKILSQTGRLLTNLRQTYEAEPYILGAIDIAKNRKDTISLVYEYHLLSGNYRREQRYETADSLLREAVWLGKSLPGEIRAITYMKLGELKKLTGEIDSARYYVRQSIDSIVFHSKNIALVHAAQIYQQAGMTDSAYIFASRLVNSSRPDNKECGYQILLSSPYRSFLPLDSIESYYDAYTDLLDKYYSDNNNRIVREQQTSYNYKIQQEKRREADMKAHNRAVFIVVLLVVLIIAINLVIFFKIRSHHNRQQLEHALTDLRYLKMKLGVDTINPDHLVELTTPWKVQSGAEYEKSHNYPDFKVKNSEEYLRTQLRNELMNIYQANRNPEVDIRLQKSSIYNKFLTAVNSGKSILATSKDWEKLASAVSKVSPDFHSNLELLYGGPLKEMDYRIALLIKCGFRTKDIASIVSLTMAAINYYRKRLVQNFSDKEMGYPVMEAIIRQI